MRLTPRQQEVLEFIRAHISLYERPPTRLEIAQYFGWASPNAAEDHLKALKKKGAIFMTKGLARAIQIA